MPIIILEGIDGSGKSTLAEHIRDLSPWPATIIHKGPIKTTVMDELILPLYEVEPDELVIADRWHLSEMIYGPLYRGMSQINWPLLLEIESVLTSLKAMRVLLKPDLEVVSKRLATRGEDFLKSDDVPLVYAAYSGFADLLEYHTIPFSDKLAAGFIVNALQKRLK